MVPSALSYDDFGHGQRALDPLEWIVALLGAVRGQQLFALDRHAAVFAPNVARGAMAGLDHQRVEAAFARHLDGAKTQRLADTLAARAGKGAAHGAVQRLARAQRAEAQPTRRRTAAGRLVDALGHLVNDSTARVVLCRVLLLDIEFLEEEEGEEFAIRAASTDREASVHGLVFRDHQPGHGLELLCREPKVHDHRVVGREGRSRDLDARFVLVRQHRADREVRLLRAGHREEATSEKQMLLSPK
mmetsp:Transcript_14264/g.28925  ORF Transcript_14264/g.28925 Transcript_14264/m.28925 type:complete len:245 (+) Transcript_14264:154-888(+)|eukprot:CAMPEP_0119066822 /NCGR_PEP_ID=MMETSP1178-20130426/9270_1 /TAXON_ID=33656 /ORGANISM="unid sp, Strain CCMP2000" /LENGTH=244 /DNA_ID=CAMNT_0007048449 /DNA_START=152 /DNA_END=886 /DNA_ORIENTATION=+